MLVHILNVLNKNPVHISQIAIITPKTCLSLVLLLLTCVYPEASAMEFAHVEVKANDGKHEDGKEEQQANLQQRYHSFHNGLQYHLKT